VEETEALIVSYAHRYDLDSCRKLVQGWIRTTLSDVVTLVQDLHKVQTDTTYPNIGIFSYARGLFRKPHIAGLQTSATYLNRVHAGQFIYSRLFAFEGAYGMVYDEFDNYFVSNEYPTFNCNTEKVLPEFLYAYFKSPTVWKDVAVGSKGLGDRRQRVQPQQILTHRFMLPPIEYQYGLRQLMAKAGTLKQLHSETAAELDAMLPSILDKAFQGAL
jgi:type I restriction enzyme S subunit